MLHEVTTSTNLDVMAHQPSIVKAREVLTPEQDMDINLRLINNPACAQAIIAEFAHIDDIADYVNCIVQTWHHWAD